MSAGEGWAGACLCGAVRYRFTLTASRPTICHCESCRRSAGAPIVTWVTVPVNALHMDGESLRVYPSSDRVERGFCCRCGTTLTYRHLDYPDTVDITTATLDDPEALPPDDQIWTVDRLSYMKHAEALPAYERTRKG